MKDALTTTKFKKQIGRADVPRNKILRYEGYLFTKAPDEIQVGIDGKPWDSEVIELGFDD